jgi:hypothetical protein
MKFLFNFINSRTLLKIIEAFLIHNLLIKINAFVEIIFDYFSKYFQHK